jgi:hypothetical protein
MQFSSLRNPHILIQIATLAFAGTVVGDPPNRPAWWTNEATRVILPGVIENNQGPANIGQAKHMARAALLALRASGQTQIADDIEAVLVGPPVAGSPSLNPPLASWDPPTTPAEKEKQKAPLLIGQLKAISAPFHLKVYQAAPAWLTGERSIYGLLDNGTYPWTTSQADDANMAPATIGQVKAVFSLDFASDREVAPNTDGLSDLWEIVNFGSLSQSATGDPDNDGLNNAQEYGVGTRPNSTGDADGDDLSNEWELFFGLNPNDFNGPGSDFDGDGVEDYLDARPNDPLVGQVAIVISNPLNGSTH